MATVLTRPEDAAARAAAAPSGRPDDRPPHTAGSGRRRSLVQRVNLAVVCLGFAGLTLAQQPGKVLPDTKLDLSVDPWGFLGRSLQLWEPEGFAGQLQNQTYGYLFPMGPFYGLGQAAGLPAWVVQRLWMALLLGVAFLGVVTLARRLRIGTPEARLLAGLAYALAPRMITGLGATSVEVLPMALAPWVLVPLVAGARGGSPRRAAALSGLAVFWVGGVNAVATAAVLPLAALYLLTRPAGPRRRRLIGAWVASVALATAWWVGPLLLLGRYSPPFLDYIESAATTTAPTGLFSAMRGTTQWLAYLADARGPIWPAGWSLVHDALPIAATVVLAVVGLLGLVRGALPDRTWLVLGVLAGLVLVTAGHLGAVQGLAAEPLHTALDGVLAPLRNVHKFDPVLRLPLALGVAAACGPLFRAIRRRPLGDRGAERRRLLTAAAARTAVGVVVLALVTTASPAVGGRLAPPTGFESVPGYWREAADWLADARPAGRALLLPASSFGTYVWGTTADEPLQPLARSGWEVRSAVPLTPAAHVRMLDAIEDRLAEGRGSTGLAPYLARAGISHLVVRNDLDAGAAGATRPILVHQALRDSPGITRVATFGPRIPAVTSLLGRALDAFLLSPRASVEVYAVADPAPRAYTVPLSGAVTVAGGPDAVLALEDRGLLGTRPALLADGESSDTGGGSMVSDAQMRRERSFGRVGAAASAALTADDPLRLEGRARDYLYPGAEAGESVVRLEGATVTASSSASDADTFAGTRPADQPYAAVDGDPTTAWRPADRLGRPQPVWWSIRADRLVTAQEVVVRLADDPGQAPRRIELRTDSGRRTVTLADTTAPQRLPLPAGATRSLTIGLASGAPTTATLALAEVSIPGLSLSRTVVTPAVEGVVDAYAFDTGTPATNGCATEATGRPRCAPALVRAAEEPGGLDRVLTVTGPAAYDIAVTAVPRPGPELDALIATTARPWGPVVSASSTAVPDPRAGADAAVDGDPETAWIAAPDASRPSLTLAWAVPQTVDELTLTVTEGTAASVPTAVTVGAGGLEQSVPLDENGTARFAPVTTDRLTLSFPMVDELTSFDPYTRQVSTLGVGISELRLDGVPVAPGDTAVDVPCGEGPVVEIDGRRRQTEVRTTLAGLRSLAPVRLGLCDDGESTGLLAAGEHRFAARSTATVAVTSATLRRSAAPTADPVRRDALHALRWEAEHRTLEVAARTAPVLLVLPENTNPGWVARLGGQRLEARAVDGWQQGWVVPAGAAGVVELDFAPGAAYRAALAVGAGAALLLVVLLLVPARRPGPAPTGRRRRAGVVTMAVAAAATAVIGGGVGLVALVSAVGLGAAARARRRTVLALLAGAAMLCAGAVALVAPGADTALQTLALVSLAAVVASVFSRPGRPDGVAGTRSRRRRSGRSTST